MRRSCSRRSGRRGMRAAGDLRPHRGQRGDHGALRARRPRAGGRPGGRWAPPGRQARGGGADRPAGRVPALRRDVVQRRCRGSGPAPSRARTAAARDPRLVDVPAPPPRLGDRRGVPCRRRGARLRRLARHGPHRGGALPGSARRGGGRRLRLDAQDVPRARRAASSSAIPRSSRARRPRSTRRSSRTTIRSASPPSRSRSPSTPSSATRTPARSSRTRAPSQAPSAEAGLAVAGGGTDSHAVLIATPGRTGADAAADARAPARHRQPEPAPVRARRRGRPLRPAGAHAPRRERGRGPRGGRHRGARARRRRRSPSRSPRSREELQGIAYTWAEP